MFATDSYNIVLSLSAILIIIHFFCGKIRFIKSIPRSAWLSFAGGISIAYVFVHLIPELAADFESAPTIFSHSQFLKKHYLYIVAMLGFLALYITEKIILLRPERGKSSEEKKRLFILHIASFSLYNLIIGILLLAEVELGIKSAVFYTFALGAHFLVNDYGLRFHHAGRYDRYGRWILSLAIFSGTILGMILEIPESITSVMIAFLGGGIILNVIKEELPEQRKSRFSMFAAGSVFYTLLLWLSF